MNLKVYTSFSLRNFLMVTAVLLSTALSVCLIFSCLNNNRMAIAIEHNTPTIIVDPGHGGEDGGTQSSQGILEKDLNLSIALKINEILKDKGYETVLIREDDRLIYDESCTTIREKKKSDLHNRLKIINNTPNSIFLSIHQNYYTESKYYGSQVFYSGNNEESKALAGIIQETIRKKLQPENTRQIKESGSEIFLLYNSSVPSVMVECGFLSNYEEAIRLSDDNYQQLMADAVVEGLIEYINIAQVKI